MKGSQSGDVVGIWRSPLDKVAAAAANALALAQPRCSIGFGQDFSEMTVYNFGYYISPPSETPEAALTALFNAMSPGSTGAAGGVAFMPQQSYAFADTTYFPFAVPDQCNVVASGGAGTGDSASFYHFVIQATGHLTFLACEAAAYTTGGVYFHGLGFRWQSSSNEDTCILAAVANCSAVRCTFTDCPTAFSAQGPGCMLKQCTIDYLGGSPGGATAVVLAGSQCAVLGPCEFEQTPVPPNPSGNGNGPKTCTCISVQGGADHVVIADAHISDWTTGIDFSKGSGSTNAPIASANGVTQ